MIRLLESCKEVLAYLQGTKDRMLTYRQFNDLEVKRYSNIDFTGCVDTIESIFGYLFHIVGGVISWTSAKHTIIVAPTIKAEFVACFEDTVHSLWLRHFILGLEIVDSIAKSLKIYCDNNAAIFFSKND